MDFSLEGEEIEKNKKHNITLFQTIWNNRMQISEGNLLKNILLEFNAYYIFEELYNSELNIQTKNYICAYIIFLFSKNSTWLDLSKNYLDFKVATMTNLYSFNFEFNEVNSSAELYIHELNPNFTQTRDKYIEYQCDYVFTHAVSLSIHISNCLKKCSDSGKNISARELNENTKLINGIPKLKKDLFDLISRLNLTNLTVDKVVDLSNNSFSKTVKIPSIEERIHAKTKSYT